MPEDRKPRYERMRSVQRESLEDEFRITDSELVPEVPRGGARIKVIFAGACYTDGEVSRNRQNRIKTPGVHDTSLFPGYEISGEVDEVCNTIAATCGLQRGDRVIVYPDNQQLTHTGYTEYMTVRDINNLLHVPDNVSLEVAALLPCGALTAYAAAKRAKPFVRYKLDHNKEACHVLVVGAGGLGLWTLKMATYVMQNPETLSRVHITVADTNVEKLMLAKEYGCVDVIHWSDEIHEQYILERTRDVCPGGVDVIIDFVSSPRTISRGLKLLKQSGVMIVGGNTKYEMTFDLHTLAKNNQSIVGVNTGSRKQLQDLLDLFQQNKITPPVFSIFPVDEVNQVFAKLNSCQIQGRAVLRVSDSDEPDTLTTKVHIHSSSHMTYKDEGAVIEEDTEVFLCSETTVQN